MFPQMLMFPLMFPLMRNPKSIHSGCANPIKVTIL